MTDKIVPPGKVFHRRKTLSGSGFTTKFVQEDKDVGLYCKNCGKRIPWKRLLCKYDFYSGDIIRTWVCECGAHLREDELK